MRKKGEEEEDDEIRIFQLHLSLGCVCKYFLWNCQAVSFYLLAWYVFVAALAVILLVHQYGKFKKFPWPSLNRERYRIRIL